MEANIPKEDELIVDDNGDGTAELSAIDWGAGAVAALMGYGEGSFAAAATLAGKTNLRSIVLADICGDGTPDFVRSRQK